MGYELLEDCTHTELMDMVIRLRVELKAARVENDALDLACEIHEKITGHCACCSGSML